MLTWQVKIIMKESELQIMSEIITDLTNNPTNFTGITFG